MQVKYAHHFQQMEMAGKAAALALIAKHLHAVLAQPRDGFDSNIVTHALNDMEEDIRTLRLHIVGLETNGSLLQENG